MAVSGPPLAVARHRLPTIRPQFEPVV